MNLRGKTAVITGSTSGIGLAIAEALAAQGANIVLNGLVAQPAEGEAIAAALVRQQEGKAIFHGADMRQPDDITSMITTAAETFGSVDILVNNAGIQHTATTEDFPPQQWEAIIAINLSAAFYASQAALPYMQRQGWGRIINTASVHGLVASVQKAAYVAAKHGLVGLTKVIALENAEKGITCNAICPGWVDTPLIQQQIQDLAARDKISLEDGRRRLVGAKQPSQAFVQPAQLGALAVFLCSEAAAQLTGAALPVDGGWTAQ